jgi:dihydroorotate dehydrogenase (fumarate)
MAGAKVAMMASSLLTRGPAHLARLLEDMIQWMDEHQYSSISQMRGSMSQLGVADPAAFERANYVKALSTFGA